jgi:general secretion pathway protein D
MNLRQTGIVALLCALPAFASAQDSGAGKTASGASDRDHPELADIIESFSKRTGRKFIVDPRVRATGGLVGIDANRITYEELLALASVHQFVVVTQGNVTIVAPDAGARQQPTPVYTDARFKALDDEWVTLLLSAKNACTAHLVPILRPLMPQAAHLAADPMSNQIIVSDRAVNVRRIANLIARLDDAAPAGRGCPDWQPSAAPKKGS